MISRIYFSAILAMLFAGSAAQAAISGKDLFTGQSRSISHGPKGTVVVFMSAKCPCSNSHNEILRTLANEFKEFTFVAVHSNIDESLKSARDYFEKLKFPFFVIQDEHFKLADDFKANKTPHAFVLTPSGALVYRGGITNSIAGESADTNFLKEALSDIRTGRAVRVAQSRTLGCAITR